MTLMRDMWNLFATWLRDFEFAVSFSRPRLAEPVATSTRSKIRYFYVKIQPNREFGLMVEHTRLKVEPPCPDAPGEPDKVGPPT